MIHPLASHILARSVYRPYDHAYSIIFVGNTIPSHHLLGRNFAGLLGEGEGEARQQNREKEEKWAAHK
jgi:hypothetical protein